MVNIIPQGYYSVYAETLLLYQFEKMDYQTFVEQFQEISLFERKRKPLKPLEFKLYLRTMHKVVKLYKSLLIKHINQITIEKQNDYDTHT